MNKQFQQEFLNECVSILQEVDEDKFNLSAIWIPSTECGCVMGHYKIRQGNYYLYDEGYMVPDPVYSFQKQEYEDLFQFLTHGLKFNEKQAVELKKIFGFGKTPYGKLSIFVGKDEVLAKLREFMRNNEFETEEQSAQYAEFDAVKSLLR